MIREKEEPMERATDESKPRLSTADMANAARAERGRDILQELETAQPVSPGQMNDGQPTPLLTAEQTQSFKNRWTNIQTSFVDEPRHAVEEADGLVAELMQHLAEMFSDERATLERQWSRGDNVSTEDLRLALQRYRSFFDRLLSL